ncbi:MAG: ATP synthase F0 subunit B [Lachnospiraceae bacterium]|nr:ATP synthase F0 subunit B [Lachnospiraceae bacterium]
MPLNIDFVQILLHMLNFVILAGGLSLILFKPVQKFMKEREERFKKAKEENEIAAEENAALKAEYETKLRDAEQEIQQLRLTAEQDAADAAKQYLDAAKDRSQEIIAEAEREAEERKDHILESAQTEIGELVIEATQKLMKESAGEAENRALYDEFIRVAQEDS